MQTDDNVFFLSTQTAIRFYSINLLTALYQSQCIQSIHNMGTTVRYCTETQEKIPFIPLEKKTSLQRVDVEDLQPDF